MATGSGEVAIRAAAAGARVTGCDIAPRMLELARANAPEIHFDLGDVQDLPYDDASFDAVSSCFGFIFAPDHEATARELARVCRERLGFTAWEPQPVLGELYARFGLDSPEGRLPFQWGKPGHAEELLGPFFDLEIEQHTWYLHGEDGEDLWEFWTTAAPPFKAMVSRLDDQELAAFREAYIEYNEDYREGDIVRVPRPYLLVLGTKR